MHWEMQLLSNGLKLGFPKQVDFTCAEFRINCAQIKATELRAIARYIAQFRLTFLRMCFKFFDKIQFKPYGTQ